MKIKGNIENKGKGGKGWWLEGVVAKGGGGRGNSNFEEKHSKGEHYAYFKIFLELTKIQILNSQHTFVKKDPTNSIG